MKIHILPFENGFRPVVGTTGFTQEQIADLMTLSADKNWAV